MFRAIDFDNDGSLTLTELQSFAETALRGAISTMRMSGSRLRISIGTQEIEASSDKDALKKKVWDEVARVIAEVCRWLKMSRGEWWVGCAAVGIRESVYRGVCFCS